MNAPEAYVTLNGLLISSGGNAWIRSADTVEVRQ